MKTAIRLSFSLCLFVAFQIQSINASVTPVVSSLKSKGKPINLAILWHQHQPRYYKDESINEYAEPWVRLHCIKDYFDMAAMAEEFPHLKLNINITPVLVRQIEDIIAIYESGKPCDKAMRLSLKDASTLTDDEKFYVLRRFFDANWRNMIDLYPRYKELRDKRLGLGEGDLRKSISIFTASDLRDLQVWFNLVWFDPDFLKGDVMLPSGKKISLRRFVEKGRGFTEAEKVEILRDQMEIARNVIPIHRELQKSGKIELITTPYFHPILPLIVDTNIGASREKDVQLPRMRFSYPEDAREQLTMAYEFAAKTFSKNPAGLWPSEEAVSNDIVPIVKRAGFQWMVTDEGILRMSLGKSGLSNPEKCRAYFVKRDGEELGVFFRDTRLSNKIGFDYSPLDPVAAANDFLNQLHQIQVSLANSEEENIVVVALDGENAWENYRNDGKEFLRSLYSQLTQAKWVKTVKLSDFFKKANASKNKTYVDLWPGSWAGNSFKTWIGEKEENTAWELLAQVRGLLEEAKASGTTDPDKVKKAELLIYAAEGSDWFWWYGDDQNSGYDEEFDKAFRKTLMDACSLLGREIPSLSIPIVEKGAVVPSGGIAKPVTPQVDGMVGPGEWDSVPFYEDSESGKGAMKGGTEMPVKGFYLASDGDAVFVRIDFTEPLSFFSPSGKIIKIYFSSPSMPGRAVQSFSKRELGDALPETIYPPFAPSGRVRLDLLAAEDSLSTAYLEIPRTPGEAKSEKEIWVRSEKVGFGLGGTLEVKIPLSSLNVTPMDELKFSIFLEDKKGDYFNNLDIAPSEGYGAITIPFKENVMVLNETNDPLGDDRGPGSYIYPSNSVFMKGAYDIENVRVLEGGDAVFFEIKIAGEVTKPWGGKIGFCLQDIDIYLDTDGLKGSGRTDLLTSRNAKTSDDSAWEFAIMANMDEVMLYDKNMKRFPDAIKAYADPSRKTIGIKVSETVIGAPADTWKFHLFMIGHDGYGPGRVRPITRIPGEWTFGGSINPSLEPRIIDMIVPENSSQESILGAYKLTGKLSELPGLQFLGAER
ncbi:MAG: glucodextranase DOMON-like domain-containing protein [Candidatus Eisenbacteria bacterium]|nr:glucodextranase DOMON-like domain-containing protein [Candidatus Eisenbacteria bacterium]